MTALVGFSDNGLFSDGAGFRLWTPPKVGIINRRLVFHTTSRPYERERDFAEFGGGPARHCYLLETTEGGGSQLDVWLRVAEHRPDVGDYKFVRHEVDGWLDATSWGGPMLPLRWSPEAGLNAHDAIAWAAETFGKRHAQKIRAELGAMCARLWAGVPR